MNRLLPVLLMVTALHGARHEFAAHAGWEAVFLSPRISLNSGTDTLPAVSAAHMPYSAFDWRVTDHALEVRHLSAVVAANHGGNIPYDGTAVRMQRGQLHWEEHLGGDFGLDARAEFLRADRSATSKDNLRYRGIYYSAGTSFPWEEESQQYDLNFSWWFLRSATGKTGVLLGAQWQPYGIAPAAMVFIPDGGSVGRDVFTGSQSSAWYGQAGIRAVFQLSFFRFTFENMLAIGRRGFSNEWFDRVSVSGFRNDFRMGLGFQISGGLWLSASVRFIIRRNFGGFLAAESSSEQVTLLKDLNGAVAGSRGTVSLEDSATEFRPSFGISLMF